MVLDLPIPVHIADWLLVICGVCAALAALLPPAKEDSHVAWKVARSVIDALAWNFKNAKNGKPVS